MPTLFFGKHSGVFAVAAIVALGCQSAPSDGDDDDDNNDTGDENDLGIDCESDRLFDRGPSAVTIYNLYDIGELIKQARYSYEYDDNKQRTKSTVRIWNEGEVIAEYERAYTYEEGRPVLLEWVNNDIPGWRIWEYDDQGRLSKHLTENEKDGVIVPFSTDTYEYGPDGRPSRRLYEYHINPDSNHGFGFEYDDEGRLDRVISLDPQDDWAPTGNYTVYEYDPLSRIAGFTEVADDLEPVQSTCEYQGQTGWLTQCASDTEITTYEWEGDTLTVTTEEIIDGDAFPRDKTVYEFTDKGDSAFSEVAVGIHFYNWIMYEYGNGVINGCIGLDSDL